MKVSISYDGKYCETSCHLFRAETYAGFMVGKARCIKFGELEVEVFKYTWGRNGYKFIRQGECVAQTKELTPRDIELVHEPWGRFK